MKKRKQASLQFSERLAWSPVKPAIILSLRASTQNAQPQISPPDVNAKSGSERRQNKYSRSDRFEFFKK